MIIIFRNDTILYYSFLRRYNRLTVRGGYYCNKLTAEIFIEKIVYRRF